MSKKSYYVRHEILSEIEAATDLLCCENGSCSPTDVLRLLRYNESDEMRSVVVACAYRNNLFIVRKGRGMRIAIS